MKTIKIVKMRSWSQYKQHIISAIVFTLFLTGVQSTLQAQTDLITKPSWWFGIAGGTNLNFYQGSTHNISSNNTFPAVFHNGFGVGLFLAPLIEYHNPDSRWGMMFQVGYDNRKGTFEQVNTPCNCPADLSTKLSYLTIEPSLRFAPFKSNLYLFVGPRLAINLEKSFIYEQGINPAYPNQVAPTDVEGDLSNVNKILISMQVGAGYDIPISSQNRQTQFVLSPFVSYQPYFGQTPRSIDTWNMNTLRVGAALKVGRTKSNVSQTVKSYDQIIEPINFYVISPKNIPVERRVRETFPLRNYIFFDLGSSKIPNRYILLEKNQVKGFKEDQIEVLSPKRLSGRSEREMIVYYNILNILGDRMGKNPASKILLTGSSMDGSDDGLLMAISVKQYLVNIFSIDSTRISTKGRIKPQIMSEKKGGTKELKLLREDDRRVTISSDSPELMMEFQTGPDVPLKSIQMFNQQIAPIDSYVTFIAEGSKLAFTSWSLEIKDEKGKIQYFGPYTQEKVRIAGKSIMGKKAEGDYIVTMVGHTKKGDKVRKNAATSIHMVLWTPSENEEGMRFSVLYEFDESNSIQMYDKYLTEIVTPKIPKNGTVIIHGHTDIIGDKIHNQELSIARANDVKGIIGDALAKVNRTDVTFEVYGFGDNQNAAPFDNKFSEERFYNRTVIIDIIPPK